MRHEQDELQRGLCGRCSMALLPLLLPVLGLAGCMPVLTGGRYAVRVRDCQDLGLITPRVVIAFYDSGIGCPWAKVVTADVAATGYDYPLRLYCDWGMLGAVVPTLYEFPGIYVLADGYWPAWLNTNSPPFFEGRPPDEQPTCTRRESLRDPTMIPAKCGALWQVLMIPADDAYSGEVSRCAAAGSLPLLLPEFARAIQRSRWLKPDDKVWIYQQFLTVLRAEWTRRSSIPASQRPEPPSSLEEENTWQKETKRWIDRLERRSK
jgi:hypothetical protein